MLAGLHHEETAAVVAQYLLVVFHRLGDVFEVIFVKFRQLEDGIVGQQLGAVVLHHLLEQRFRP